MVSSAPSYRSPSKDVAYPADLWPFAFKGAIFDFDGTVADSLDVWEKVDAIFFGRRGLTYKPDYAETLSTLGFEDGARFTIETYGLSDTPEAICDEWNDLGRELYRTDVTLRPGAARYIEALQEAGIPVALATTNHPAVINAMEERVPLEGLFPIRVHGCEVEHHTKEHPDIYLEAARRMGVAPMDCVVFEDLPAGIRCAHGIGMKTVAVFTNDSRQNKDSLVEVADYVLANWDGLAKAVESHA